MPRSRSSASDLGVASVSRKGGLRCVGQFGASSCQSGMTIWLPDRPIDLGNMQRVMEAVDNFFKGADGYLSNIESAAPDYSDYHGAVRRLWSLRACCCCGTVGGR